jgi:iron complex transport system ATP-binding protein
VGFGRHPYCDWTGRLTRKDQEVIDWALEATALETLEDRPIGKISGGEKQRAWIAMALAQEPQVMLLDEPTTFLDIAFQLQLLELLLALNRQLKLAIVMVLHDLNQAARYSQRMIVLHDGMVHQEGSPAEVVTEAVLAEVFGVKAQITTDPVYDRPHFIAGLEAKPACEPIHKWSGL